MPHPPKIRILPGAYYEGDCTLPPKNFFFSKLFDTDIMLLNIMKQIKAEKPNWKKFHEWEQGYELARLRKLSEYEKIKISEELYLTYLRLKPKKRK